MTHISISKLTIIGSDNGLMLSGSKSLPEAMVRLYGSHDADKEPKLLSSDNKKQT